MKWCDKINLTRRDKSTSRRRLTNAASIYFFLKHNHLKNASFLKHDRFDVHDEEITKKFHTLHDEIENDSKFKSHFDIHKIDDNREKKRITTSSSLKKHEHE